MEGRGRRRNENNGFSKPVLVFEMCLEKKDKISLEMIWNIMDAKKVGRRSFNNLASGFDWQYLLQQLFCKWKFVSCPCIIFGVKQLVSEMFSGIDYVLAV